MTRPADGYGEELRFIILALQRQGARQLSRALQDVGLTASQAEALEVIGTHGPLTTGQVGSYLVCESGSPSRLLATLADLGLTVRSRPESDLRATLHSLSPAGRAKLAEATRCQERFNAAMARALADAWEDVRAARSAPPEPIALLAAMVTDPDLRGALALRFPQLFEGRQ